MFLPGGNDSESGPFTPSPGPNPAEAGGSRAETPAPASSLGSGPWAWIGGAALALAGFWAFGWTFFRGFVLDLGSVNLPTPLHLAFLTAWVVFGTLATACLGVAMARLSDRPSGGGSWPAGADKKWLRYGMAAAFLLPLTVRYGVLQNAPLTDDESSYRFMAELLAQGRLVAESHPLKLFFDRGQMINDGAFYAQYFIGWPALLAPFVGFGLSGWLNPLLAALTVPALWALGSRLAGATGARLGLLLFLASPMWMIGAATDLAHTSCLAALCWAAECFFRGREPDGAAGKRPPWFWDLGFATMVSVAFFIRPQACLPFMLPFLVLWVTDRALSNRALPHRTLARRPKGRGRLVRLAAFLVPSLLMAGLFLGVNQAQTGSLWTPAYQRAMAYAAENEFRFASDAQTWDTELSHLRLDRSPVESVGWVALGLLRLTFALFGWPGWWLPVLLAVTRKGAVWWAAAMTSLVPHLWASDPGIDAFGPVHYFELGLAFWALSLIGLERAATMLDRAVGPRARRWPAALLIAGLVTSLLAYVPVRLRNLERMAESINLPEQAAFAAKLQDAVIFAPWPFVHACAGAPTRHHVRFRPNNDPELRNRVLWVNHLSVEENRRLMAHFPDRRGFVMIWTGDCRVRFLPLDGLRSDQVPAGRRRKATVEPST